MNERTRHGHCTTNATSRRCCAPSARGRPPRPRPWRPCARPSRPNGARRSPRTPATPRSSPAGPPRPASPWLRSASGWRARCCRPSRRSSHRSARVVGSVEQNRGDGRWTPVASAGVDRVRHPAAHGGGRPRGAAAGQRRRAAPRRAHAGGARTTLRTRPWRRAPSTSTAASRPARRAPSSTSDTPAGTVRHLGTQYQARIADDGVLVGVREGRVRLSHRVGRRGRQMPASELTVAGRQGHAARRSRPTAADWDWVGERHAAVRHRGPLGRRRSWCGPRARPAAPSCTRRREAARQARSVTLRGTVEGLDAGRGRAGGAVDHLAAAARSGTSTSAIESIAAERPRAATAIGGRSRSATIGRHVPPDRSTSALATDACWRASRSARPRCSVRLPASRPARPIAGQHGRRRAAGPRHPGPAG